MSINMSMTSALNRAYSGFSFFSDKSYRRGSENRDLVKADRSALSKGLSMLGDIDYEDTDPGNTKSIYNRITSLVDVYNNTKKSTAESESREIKRTSDQMKDIAKKYSKELEELGISVKNDGTLKIDTKEFKTATTKKVQKIFSEDSDFSKDLQKLMKKLKTQINRQPAPSQVPAGNTKPGGIDAYV